MSWEINGDLASVAAAGMAAIIMEVLHPSVMAGVYEQSSYRTEPLRRAQNTLGYVLRTTFGNTAAATEVIERVKQGPLAHRRHPPRRRAVPGARPRAHRLGAHLHPVGGDGGVRPLPARPLSNAEKDRYLAEQAPIGRMGGAEWVPESVAELDDYVERMRPLMAMTEQTREFIDFLAGDSDGEFQRLRAEPARAPPRHRRVDDAHAGVGPPPHRHLPAVDRATALYLEPDTRLQAAAIRWAYPELPCARMALARAEGVAVPSLPDQ